MATDSAPLFVPDVTLAVARGAAAEGALVSFDFIAGDTLTTPSKNQTDFAFGDQVRLTDGIQSPLLENGVQFRFQAAPAASDDSWSELRYVLGGNYFEAYEEVELYIPSNFEHRSLISITVSDAADMSTWQVGDIVQGGVSDATGEIYSINGTNLILLFATYRIYGDGYWANVTLTNQRDSTTASAISKFFEGTNNKFMALWEGAYSSNGIIIEYTSDYSNGAYIGSSPKVNATETDSQLKQSPEASEVPEGYIIEPSDFGKKVKYVVYRKKSSSLSAPDGACLIWKNGALIFKATSILSYASVNNFFQNGYLLGYSNSGFLSETSIILHKYKFWGDKAPTGLEGF